MPLAPTLSPLVPRGEREKISGESIKMCPALAMACDGSNRLRICPHSPARGLKREEAQRGAVRRLHVCKFPRRVKYDPQIPLECSFTHPLECGDVVRQPYEHGWELAVWQASACASVHIVVAKNHLRNAI